MAFYSVMTYFFFGTCKHLSLGTHGVVSLMIGTTIDKYSGILYAENGDIDNNNQTLNKQLNQSTSSSTLINNNFISNDVNEAKVMIATSLAFLTGCIHVSLYFFILNQICNLSF